MGYMRHHAIVVTCSGYGTHADLAHAKATEIFPWVSPISPPAVNGHRSFFVPPDGSKEGWGDSDVGDARRNCFIQWLDAYRWCDGSTPLTWVEVQYGDDDGQTVALRNSDAIQASNEYAGPAMADEAGNQPWTTNGTVESR